MKLPPFKLERYFARYEFEVPFVLSASDSETMSISELLELEPGVKEHFLGLNLGYTESRGHPLLRRETANLYRNISPDQILVHTGAEEAIYIFMAGVLEKGDEVVVQWPCYESLARVAQTGGVRVRLWHPVPDGRWQWDLDELMEMLTPKTRAVVINFPHNPTGALAGPEFLQDLAALSQRHGFIVFSDEVYRGLEYEGVETLPAFCDLDAGAVSLGVTSKAYGLPGLRLGWVASQNQAVLKTMAEFKDYTTICNPGPSEFLATVALRNQRHIINRILKIISKNLKILDGFFERHKNLFQWQAPQAGPISFVRYKGKDRAEDFCHELAREKGVLLLPGSVYDDQYDDYLRIGFGRKNLPHAINALEEWLLQRD